MGDGDCGEAVESVCRSILQKLSSETLSADKSSIFALLEPIAESVEDMGGSLGAILSIFLTAFSNSIRSTYSSYPNLELVMADIEGVAKAAGPALEKLKLYTGARVGDRTVMDTLIPFCVQLQRMPDLRKAVEAAEQGAKSTAGMKPKFGRATYIGEKKEGGELPPDPGALAVAVFLRGLLEGWQAA